MFYKLPEWHHFITLPSDSHRTL